MSDAEQESGRPERPGIPRRLVVGSEIAVRAGIIAVAVVAAGWLFLYLRVVTVPVFLALLVTSLLMPLKRALVRRGLPGLLATWLVVLATAGAAAGLIALLAPPVIDQIEDLGDQIDEGIAEIENWLATGPLGLEDVDLRDSIDHLVEQIFTGGAQRLVDGVTILGEIIAVALLAMVMSFFFLKDGERIADAGLRAFPARHRARAERAAANAWGTLGGYIRGTAIVGTVDAVGIGLGMAIIGVPLVLPIAVLTFFGAFFPIVGAVVAGTVAVLVALVALGPAEALAVLAVVVVVQQVESNVLQPVVMGRVLRLHPLVILVSLTAGAISAGLLGAFLAVPLVAIAVSVARALPDPGTGPPAGGEVAVDDVDV